MNIVDVGLVYDVVDPSRGHGGHRDDAATPGCRLSGFLDDQIRTCLTALPQVREVQGDLAREPPWQPTAMSDAAKEQLR